ncbi:MAG: hypothetical protein AB7I57_22855 [Pirellulales bacterium]
MKRLIDMTEPELKQMMTTLARRVRDGCAIMGVEKPMFVLVLFNDPAIGQYISNCERSDMIKAMRDLADRLERREDVPR